MCMKKKQLKNLLDTLENLGFFSQCNPVDITKIKEKMLNKNSFWEINEIKRDYFVDFEDLMEFGTRSFLLKIKPFLIANGVKIKSIKQNIDNNVGYLIKINDNEYLLYKWKEMNSFNIWEKTAIKIFSIVNDLLKESNSKERIYLLINNDYVKIIFLTNEMYDLITNSSIIKDIDKPIKIEEYEFIKNFTINCYTS